MNNGNGLDRSAYSMVQIEHHRLVVSIPQLIVGWMAAFRKYKVDAQFFIATFTRFILISPEPSSSSSSSICCLSMGKLEHCSLWW